MAAALRRLFPRSYDFVVRSRSGHKLASEVSEDEGSPSLTMVDTYFDVSAKDMEGYATVINLVGVTTGSNEQMTEVNASIPGHLAQEGMRAGTSRFIALSSFSVFGSADLISATSATDPASAYGRSRLAGEERISQFSEDMDCIIARVPMLYGDGSSKLEKLIRFWCRWRIMPTPANPVCRSMLHFDLAARYLDAVASSKLRGPGLDYHYIADPVCFEYRMAAHTIREALDRNCRAVVLPSVAFRLLRAASPQLALSLYSDSVLNPTDNYFRDQKVSRLAQDLADMARLARGGA